MSPLAGLTMESALEFVMSANSHRRHLTDDQRAVIAVEYKKHFAVEAEKRQKAGKADNTKISATERRSDARAAKAAGVGRSKVNAAEKVMKTATPKDIDDVRKGKKTLKQIAPKTPKVKATCLTATVSDIVHNDAKVLVAAIKLAAKSADDLTANQVQDITADLQKVANAISDLNKAFALAEKRHGSKLIKKGGKQELIAAAFATELGR